MTAWAAPPGTEYPRHPLAPTSPHAGKLGTPRGSRPHPGPRTRSDWPRASPPPDQFPLRLIHISAKAGVRLDGGAGIPYFFDTHMIAKTITNTIVPEAERLAFVYRLFGIGYVVTLEPTVFHMAQSMASAYSGAYWTFHSLTNAGFYMSPRLDTMFDVCCTNGFEGKLSADGLGVTACLYAFSHLSFGNDRLAQVCAHQYGLLREYMFEHLEVRSILAAID